MTYAQLNRKLRGLETKIKSLVVRSIKKHQREIVKRNQAQLKAGEDANGDQLGHYQSKSWIRKRKKKGRQVKYVDLRFTNEWQKSMYVKLDSEGLSFNVDAKKKKGWSGGDDVLVHHWGEDIYGLNDDNFDWLLDKITDDIYTGLLKYFT